MPIKHHRRSWLAWLTVLALLCLGSVQAFGAGFTVIYPFSALPVAVPGPGLNSDGASPASRMVMAMDGNLYGTTRDGGPKGAGTVFQTTLAGSLSTFYSFQGITDDFGNPFYDFAPNDLVLGPKAVFYGTTQRGGTNRTGTIFALSPTGVLTTLYSFSEDSTNNPGSNADGENPSGALAQGNDGNFYGTTQYGGANGTGVIFQLTPNGVFSNVYSFSALNNEDANSDGANPNALILGSDGHFYGTTQAGGANGAGEFFQFSLAGGVAPLYSFGATTNDAATPQAVLVQGTTGNFYGTSELGGRADSGAIFEATPAGAVSVLYSFSGGNDGGLPNTSLTLGTDGNYFGTTGGEGANQTGTIFKITPTGTFNTLYSFTGLDTNSFNNDGAYPAAALVVGSDGNLYGSCAFGGPNGSGSLFEYSSTAFVKPITSPLITRQPPAATNGVVGATLTLSLTVAGAPTLYYQWFKNGTALNDGGEIAGSQTSALVLGPLGTNDAGNYSVIVTNSFNSATSTVSVVTVAADKVAPGVAITSPIPNARTASPVFSGTASDNAQVVNVFYGITNVSTGSAQIGPATLTQGSGTTVNWSFAATPLPGTNILVAQSVDYSGNVSTIASVTFFYQVPSPLSVTLAGPVTGVISGTASAQGDTVPANGALLNLGESYTITALGNQSSLFSNWVISTDSGTVVSNAATLKFIMQPDLALTANFVTNFFLGATGTYNGLFSPDAGISEETSGMLSDLIVAKTGLYVGRMMIAGKIYPLNGTFNLNAHASNVVGLASDPGGQLTVELNLNTTTPQITGTVSNSLWSANLLAERAGIGLPSAQYTLLLMPQTAAPASPPGDGYAMVLDHAGLAVLVGRLADGSVFAQAVQSSATGDIPFYFRPYANTGLVMGWINLASLNAGPSTNVLTWIKKPGRLTPLYTNGFTNLLAVQGSLWTKPPAATPPIVLTNGQLVISNSSLALTFTNVSVGVNNTLIKTGAFPTNTLTGLINPATGLMSLTFGNGNGRAITAGFGIALQNQNSAGGFFLTTTNAGAFSLQQPP